MKLAGASRFAYKQVTKIGTNGPIKIGHKSTEEEEERREIA